MTLILSIPYTTTDIQYITILISLTLKSLPHWTSFLCQGGEITVSNLTHHHHQTSASVGRSPIISSSKYEATCSAKSAPFPTFNQDTSSSICVYNSGETAVSSLPFSTIQEKTAVWLTQQHMFIFPPADRNKKSPCLKCCSNTLSCIWQAHLCGWSSFFTLLKSISRSDSSAAG